MILLHFILLIIFCYLVLCTGYNLLFSIAGLFDRRPSYSHAQEKKHFAILIPTYKEDHIIIQTVKNALSQDYPRDKFDVIVIADQLQTETLTRLAQLPIRLVRVSFKKSTKAKSLKFALQQLSVSRYDIVMILDADNLMGKGCLEKTNHAFSKGFKVVQLHRTAKNKNTATAILDAVSEEIGNTIHRKGHRALGLSATLIGSGMAFDYRLFKSVMTDLNIDDNPAEDREINTELLRRGFTCEYIDDALVYDEKVASNAVLERQRTRWISAQLSYIKRFWFTNPLKTLTVNADYTDYALQTLILPRSMLVVATSALGLTGLLFLCMGRQFYPGSLFWIGIFIIMILSLIISIGKNISRSDLKIACFHFPSTFWSFLKAAGKSSSGQKDFIHTPKEFTHDLSSAISENLS